MSLYPRNTNWLTLFAGAICAMLFIAVLTAAPLGGTLASEGERVYGSSCSICHGPDGSGNTTTGKRYKIPDLRSPEVQKQSDAQLSDIVANGKSEGNKKMKPFKDKLTPAQTQQVVAYMRELGKKR